MTCIVGYVEGNRIWMGGDSAGTTWSLEQDLYDTPKVFRNGGALIGTSGSARQADLLRHSLTVPDHDPRVGLEKWMATTFINAVRQCFKDGGVCGLKENIEQSQGVFLIGYQGRLAVIYSDFQVRWPKLPYAAVGCGEQIALGAMYASEHVTDGRERIDLALRASERFSAGVRGPFHIEVLEPAEVAVAA